MMPDNKSIVVAINNEDIFEFPDYRTAQRYLDNYHEGRTLHRKYTCADCGCSVLLAPIQFEEMKPDVTAFQPRLGPCAPSESWRRVTGDDGLGYDGWLCGACFSRLLKAFICSGPLPRR